MVDLKLPRPMSLEGEQTLRDEVRRFIADELGHSSNYAYLGGRDAEFTRKCAQKGWIGMTWPKQYGGHERSMLERYIVAEELIAARAPLGAHWTGDRQTGPLLLRYGTEEQRRSILPEITAGRAFFCIGMSEPDSGSDLASVRTKAEKVPGGYVVNGAKIWTSSAHRSNFMILLCRTAARSEQRHEGLSQLIVDMKTPGVECRQIENLPGEEDFNEVVFQEAFVPENMLVGREGNGWEQVGSELAHERAGPERYLSTLGLLQEIIDKLGRDPSERAAVVVGRLVSHLYTLRRLSWSVATLLQQGDVPVLQASIVKDLGTNLEQQICEEVRQLAIEEPDVGSPDSFANALGQAMLWAPSSTIRGGTREVLRSMIARGLGLR